MGGSPDKAGRHNHGHGSDHGRESHPTIGRFAAPSEPIQSRKAARVAAAHDGYVYVDDGTRGETVELIRSTFGRSDPRWLAWYDQADSSDFRAWRYDGMLVAALRHDRLALWLGDRPVPSAQVMSVSVPPIHSGRGYGSALLRELLAELRDAGHATAGLYPTTAALYRKLGFEFAGAHSTYRVTPTHLPRGLGARRGRVLTANDLAPVRALYQQLAPGRNGALDRSERWWRRHLEPPTGIPSAAYGIFDGNEIVGWSIVQFTLTEVPYATLKVLDWGCRPGFEQALLGLWGGWSSITSAVSWVGPQPDLLHWVLGEQHTKLEEDKEWMLRVIDMPAAFTARGWPGAVNGTVNFNLVDEVAPWNTGAWTVTFTDGRAIVTPSVTTSSALVTPRALGPLLTGHVDPAALASLGLISGFTSSEIELLRLAHAGPRPWAADYY
ncbi:MAG TPA: GNAT family N-acetyltransferase [Mycobacteriales bacterium]|nr:GNAT family N-acetyltransferase [Mycobacteriales bacterium]